MRDAPPGSARPGAAAAVRDSLPDVAAVRAALGDEAFRAAWTLGRALPLAQAVQEALDLRIRRPPADGAASQPAEGATALTRRERQVATLIAQGLTNRQIAARLQITEGTAGSHVEHILAKLDFQSRAQIAVWAVEHGLLNGGDR